MSRYPGAALPALGKHWRMEADVAISSAETSGMVAQWGDWFVGWGLLLEHARPLFIYRSSDQERDVIKAAGTEPLAPGRHTFVVDVSRVGMTPQGSLY